MVFVNRHGLWHFRQRFKAIELHHQLNHFLSIIASLDAKEVTSSVYRHEGEESNVDGALCEREHAESVQRHGRARGNAPERCFANAPTVFGGLDRVPNAKGLREMARPNGRFYL